MVEEIRADLLVHSRDDHSEEVIMKKSHHEVHEINADHKGGKKGNPTDAPVLENVVDHELHKRRWAQSQSRKRNGQNDADRNQVIIGPNVGEELQERLHLKGFNL